MPQKKQAQDGVDEWLFDGAKDADGDSEGDDAPPKFRMVAGSELQALPAGGSSSPSKPLKLVNYINFQECDIADEHVFKDGCTGGQSPGPPLDPLLRHSDQCSSEKQSEPVYRLQDRLVEADAEIEFLRTRVAQLEHFSMSNEKAANDEQEKEQRATKDEQDASPTAALQKENDVLRSQIAELQAKAQQDARIHAPRPAKAFLRKENDALRSQIAELRAADEHKPMERPRAEAKVNVSEMVPSKGYFDQQPNHFLSFVFNPFAACHDCHKGGPTPAASLERPGGDDSSDAAQSIASVNSSHPDVSI